MSSYSSCGAIFLRRRTFPAILFLSGFLIFLSYSLIAVGHRPPIDNPRYWSGETKYWGGEDEHLYTLLGQRYLEGLLRLDLSSFLFAPTHPFLAKLFVGIISLLMRPFNLGDYPFPSRIVSSLTASVVCLIVFLLVENEAGHKYALFSWTALVLSYLLYPLERFIGPELNGISFTDLHFGIWNESFLSVPIDNTCLMFSSLVVFVLARKVGRRDLLMAGVFYGLSSLSKLTGFAAMGLFILGWLSFKSMNTREWLSRSLIVLGVGWLIFFSVNPDVWASRNLFVNFTIAMGKSSGQSLLTPLFSHIKSSEVEYGLAQFLASLAFGSGGLWIELPIFQLFIFLILCQFWTGRRFSDAQVLSLIWFVSFFFVVGFGNLTVVIGTWLVLYYAVVFLPPAALFCGLTLQSIIEILSKEEPRS